MIHTTWAAVVKMRVRSNFKYVAGGVSGVLGDITYPDGVRDLSGVACLLLN